MTAMLRNGVRVKHADATGGGLMAAPIFACRRSPRMSLCGESPLMTRVEARL